MAQRKDDGRWRPMKVLIAVMWSCLNVVSFNPQVANGRRRLETMLRFWGQSGQDVVVLTGTKRRAGVEGCEIEMMEGYQCFHFGYENRNDAHAGITIALAARLLKAAKVTQVWNPDKKLAGRLAAVRLKSACSDVLLVGMYPPPWSSPRNRSKFELTIKHADKLISEQAHRVCPILCTDANARVGLRPAEAGGGWWQDEAEQIGHYYDEKENQPGRLFRNAGCQAVAIIGDYAVAEWANILSPEDGGHAHRLHRCANCHGQSWQSQMGGRQV
eukprot:TRINITY_DN21867_c0_g1_i1.p1 TRINITY_DN21867_c0_g1~~TRINITY_DN21867_c0_g1_i1.p1  ORF type:complete len:272 (-),score=45.28 TRINITY_DN21867_c0_g1_i1:71-886(-)